VAGVIEDMPAPCSGTGNNINHNPFLHYTDILANRTRCEASVVPLTQLAADLRTGGYPTTCGLLRTIAHNMHDCSVAEGDTWLAGLCRR